MESGATGAPVLVIGTAHVIDLAEPIRLVLTARPLDGIAIELDAERAQLLFSPEGPKGRPAHIPLFARLWSVLQRRLGADLGGGMPGAEMRTAAAIARERNLPLFLIDDPVRAMLNRLLTTMPPKERITLLLGSIAGLFIPSRIVKEQMEEYVENPGEIVEELRRASPTIARVLLDERNAHMAERLAQLRARGFLRLAVVVGDAHVEGLRAELGRREIPTEGLGFSELRRLRGPSSSPS
ncbi:MAG: TraB/GumN family protein [Thermoplasmata archaeon]